MKRNHLSIFFLSFLPLLLLHHQAHAQPSTQGYQCSANQSNHPCQTYVYYRAMAPDFLDLASIGDLFGVSRLMISKPSNLSSPSTVLTPDQGLFIPITCNCNSNLSYANLTYEIKSGDTYYLVSTGKLQNLTTFQSVEIVNPTLVPTNLTIGVNVVFPIFCKCPNKTQMQNPINFLITYVVQPSDTLSSIAAKFGSNVESLASMNDANATTPSSTIFVPVTQIPQLNQNSSLSPSPSPSPSPPSPSSSSNKRKGVIIGLIICSGVLGLLLFVLLVMVLWFWLVFFRRGRGEGGLVGSKKGEKKERRKDGVRAWMKENFMEDVWECMDKYKIYDIEEVRKATSDFDAGCLIQGSVYKGRMRGEICAIKRMKWNAYEELKILQKVSSPLSSNSYDYFSEVGISRPRGLILRPI